MTRKRGPAPEARQALTELKIEIANELGIQNISEREDLDPVTRGALENGGKYAGFVGGQMVKRMIQQAESQLAGRDE